MIAQKDAKGNIVLLPVEDEPSSEQDDIAGPGRSHLGAAPEGTAADQVNVYCIIALVCLDIDDAFFVFTRAWNGVLKEVVPLVFFQSFHIHILSGCRIA